MVCKTVWCGRTQLPAATTDCAMSSLVSVVGRARCGHAILSCGSGQWRRSRKLTGGFMLQPQKQTY